MPSNFTFVVTGAEGFIGSAAVGRLVAHGYKVRALGRSCDIVTDDLGLSSGDCVLHFAGSTGVKESWADPVAFARNNVVGTAAVVEQASKAGACVVYLNTYCYGRPQYLPIDEKHSVTALTPYHLSKVQAEQLCRFYAEERGVAATSLRVFNVFGPGQDDRFVIPHIIRQVLDPSVENVVVTDLAPRRDFIYVDDIIDACTMVSEGPPGFGCYNVGGGASISVAELVQLIQNLAGIEKPVVDNCEIRRNEIDDVRADTTKFRDAFGWQPRVSIEEGLQKCLSVHRERHKSRTS